MALGPEDRALIAQLVRTAAVPVGDLLAAVAAEPEGGPGLLALLASIEGVDLDSLTALADTDGAPNVAAPQGEPLSEASAVAVTERSLAPQSSPGPPAPDLPTHRQAPMDAEVTGPVSWAQPGSGVELKLEAASQPLSPSGRTADERYQMMGEIGRGGMGRILKARDREIGRHVALKALLRGVDAPDNEVRRFWMEVQATGQLEHPSIIPIHDVGRMPNGEVFYVMKLLSGRTLGSIITALRSEDPSVVEEFTRIKLLTAFQQIAYAVAFAHSRGVMHRDIKPANIMIGRYGEAMLLDWGLAKLRSDDGADEDEPRVEIESRISGAETAAGIITGTPQYMAPEATEGVAQKVGDKADVYALGAVLYELLTLEPAIADLGFVDTIVRVRGGSIVPPRVRAPSRAITPELEELCLSTLRRDPAQRPTAQDLARSIGRILEGTRERERRRTEAWTRVREGREAVERWRKLETELRSVRAEAGRMAKSVPPWAPVKDKRPIWSIEDRVSALDIEAIGAFEQAEAAFHQALGEVPDHQDARRALAALYYARFIAAETRRDTVAQRYFDSLVRRYDDGDWRGVLAGDGKLSVSIGNGAAEVLISCYQREDRVLCPSDPESLGDGPVEPRATPLGSYLLTLRRDGQRDIRRPVWVGRGETVEVSVDLRDDDEVGDDFVLVPAGRCVVGGDDLAHGSLERRIVHVAEFAIARDPVSCGEYLAFLDDLASTDRREADHHVPRVGRDEGRYWHFDSASGRYRLPEDQTEELRWDLDLPVFGVSFEDALRYIEWRMTRTGERLRLPNEQEWEKAARGVDGRFFPWGDDFDATFCKMKSSRDTPYPQPEPVGAYPIDCSPYGVRDMAGGVRELCWTTEDGPMRPVMRGGCWHDTGLFCRLAFRHVTKPDFVNTGLGFRMVKEPGNSNGPSPA